MDRILLLAAALLWGGTLSAQRISTQFLGAFSFMGVRYLAGFLSMLPIVYWEQRYHNHAIDGEKKPFSHVLAAAILAIFLTAGTGFQQLGMFYTTAGKAGFITSLYIVIVPFFAYFVGQPLRRTAIIGSLLAMIGMYFLAYPTDGASFNRGDILIAICSVVWSIYILLVDRWAVHYAGFTLVAVEFFFASIYNLVLSQLAGEVITLNHIEAALWPILYCGFLGGGLAYSFQFIGQRGVGPTEASLLLSSETVFSVIGGWLILGEILSGRELVGCLFMLMGIISSQIKIK